MSVMALCTYIWHVADMKWFPASDTVRILTCSPILHLEDTID